MRKLLLSAAVLLALSTMAAARTRHHTGHSTDHHTASYTPPAEPGDIYTVIDFPRWGGTAQGISISEDMGRRHRDLTAVPRYSCAETTPVGVVVRFRHFDSATTELTISTTGTIISGPLQGEPPPETLHRCYQLMS